VNVLVGSLNGKISKAMLIKCQRVETANHSSILQVINNAINKIFPDGVDYKKFKLIVTDQAPVMLRVGKVLKETYPNLMHVTCLVHAIHRVCEEIRAQNPLVDKFISLTKRLLRKSAYRQQLFKTETGLKLPPNPVLVRWETWIRTAIYYSTNYSKVVNFINNLDSNSKIIKNLKMLIEINDLSDDFVEISEYEFLINSIEKLETDGLRMSEQKNILDDVKSKLKGKALVKLQN